MPQVSQVLTTLYLGLFITRETGQRLEGHLSKGKNRNAGALDAANCPVRVLPWTDPGKDVSKENLPAPR